MSTDEGLKVAEYAAKLLELHSARLSDEYYYQSLPLCVIDAVFSIGVRYSSVQRVVSRYCQYFGLPKFRTDRSALPPREQQESLASFCQRFEQVGLDTMTSAVFMNRHRTSVRNGILKSEAALRFAATLRSYQIEHLHDVQAMRENRTLEAQIKRIPGQTSGVSLQYFWMLAGSDEFVKPDRMILRFLKNVLGRAVAVADAQSLLASAVAHLRVSHPHITARLLDYEIWKFQRATQ